MVIKCNNGHWYDSNVDLVCPHCKRENGKLAIKLDDKEEDDKTVSFIDVAEGMEGLDQQIEKSIASVNNEVSDDFDFDMADIDIEDSDKTIALGFFGVSEEIQPVTGWLVCVEGGEKRKRLPPAFRKKLYRKIAEDGRRGTQRQSHRQRKTCLDRIRSERTWILHIGGMKPIWCI